MAIQVGGTSVISNNRVLQNVTGLKTVNGSSILGSGNITVSASSGPVDAADILNGSFGRSSPGTSEQTVTITGRKSCILRASITRGQRNSGNRLRIMLNGTSRSGSISGPEDSTASVFYAISFANHRMFSLNYATTYTNVYEGSGAITSLKVNGGHGDNRGSTNYSWTAYLG